MNNRYREEEKELQEETLEEQETAQEAVEESELDKATKELEKYKDLYFRTLADLQNFKKHIEEERIRERKYASQRVIEKLIYSMDIFDKALSIKTDDEKLKSFLIGFEMINTSMKQAMEEEGVKKINSLGKKFDPKYHHAIETSYDETVEEDIIVGETQSGYMFKDRVLRPALVIVNKKEIKEEK